MAFIRVLYVNLTILSYHLAVMNSNQQKVITGVLFYGECRFIAVVLLSILDRYLIHTNYHIVTQVPIINLRRHWYIEGSWQ